MSESYRLLLKSEGVKECVEWLEKEMKKTNKELSECTDWERQSYIRTKLNTQVEIKVSLEKYSKKLKHEFENLSSYDEDW